MNTITQSDIELSEKLRKACLEKGITEPRYVAQDKNGHWYHYTNIPDAHQYFFSAIYASDDPILEDIPNENWRETLMEWNPNAFVPVVEILKNTCEYYGKTL